MDLTDDTWNPVTGCTRVSPGCAHCYIERQTPMRIAGRTFARVGNEETTGIRLHPERLERLPKGPRIFTCSMSDLFHDEVPFDFIEHVFAVMMRCPERTFQVLTKRPERALEFFREVWARHRTAHFAGPLPELPDLALPNVWIGVSIENARYTWRAHVLREIPAAVRFLSCEPLLGSLLVDNVSTRTRPEPLDGAEPAPSVSTRSRQPLDLTGIDWVIVGGESGPRSRPMDLTWARELVDACRAAGVAPFVKQLGAVWAKQHTKRGLDCGPADSKGGAWDHWPPNLRVREFPNVAVPA